MNKKLTYYFYTSLIVGATVYTLQTLHIELPQLINFYLNDFLIIPIVLTPALYVLQKTRNNRQYTIPFYVVVYASCMYALIFEWLLPMFHNRYTFDWWDMVAYCLGGLVFYVLQKLD